ncbi:hypothetical protein OG906_34340 [Streptomyces sp. NBC_01426]|uniref:hypothetical protein n=1 Tax=Streptomyces sp. NBC_01426 TaxID=2975866 RepID=UPI002E369B98|nr:hypothetical protein [Streptomyces sp. NBC_01426]
MDDPVEPVALRPWGPQDGPAPRVWTWPAGDRPVLNRLAHAALVGVVKDVLPETEVGQWPLLAARMDRIRDQGGPALLAGHLARLKTDTGWKDGPASTTAGRLVDATLRSLTTPPSAPAAPASRVRVSPAAARSRSTTTPAAAAAPGRQAPAEAAVPAHRQQAAPGKGAGRTR